MDSGKMAAMDEPMEVEATASPSQVNHGDNYEEDLNRDWVITYLEGTPFVEPVEESDDESDTELDTELELAVHQDPAEDPNDGLKALGIFGTAECNHNVAPPSQTQPNTAPDTPIITPNPAAALLEWPMGGHDPVTSYKNSPIGKFMSKEYPDATDIEYWWYDISRLTPTEIQKLAQDDTN